MELSDKLAQGILESNLAIVALLDAQSRRVQPELQTWPFNVNANGLNTVLEAQPSGRIFVNGFVFSAAGAVTVTFGSSSDTGSFKPFPGFASTGRGGELVLAQGQPASYSVDPPWFIWRTEHGAALQAFLSAGVAVGGFLTYWKA